MMMMTGWKGVGGIIGWDEQRGARSEERSGPSLFAPYTVPSNVGRCGVRNGELVGCATGSWWGAQWGAGGVRNGELVGCATGSW